jgi:hypothetical protein
MADPRFRSCGGFQSRWAVGLFLALNLSDRSVRMCGRVTSREPRFSGYLSTEAEP